MAGPISPTQTSRLSAACGRVIETGWLAAVILTPVFFNLYSRRSFEADKSALFRALVMLMAAAGLVKWLDRGAGWPLRASRSVIIVVISLCAAYALITLMSIAPQISLLGSYTRLQGTYTQVSYLLFFALVAVEFRTRAQLNRLIHALILAGSAVAAYSLIQNAGLDPVDMGSLFGERVSSTIGNPIYLAAYLLMTCLVTVGQAITTWAQRRPLGGLLYASLAVLQLLAFVAAGSRGPFIGGLAGGVLFVLMLAVVYRSNWLVYGTVGAGLTLAALLVVINLPNSPLASVRDLPDIGRFFNLTATTGDSARTRLLIWDGAADLVQAQTPLHYPDETVDSLQPVRPLIGYGPETLYLAFQQYYPQALATETGYTGDTLIGRSHNETWDALVTGGLLGLVMYQGVMMFVVAMGLRGLGLLTTRRDRWWLIGLWLMGGLIGGMAGALIEMRYFGLGLPFGTLIGLLAYLWRNTRQAHLGDATPDRVVLAAILAAVIGHYVEIQWGIAVSTSNVIFWTLAAVCVILSRPTPLAAEPSSGSRLDRVVQYGLLAAVINALFLYMFITNYDQLRNPTSIVWRALTHNNWQGADSTVVLWLVLGVAALAALLGQTALAGARLRQRAGIAVLTLLLALGLSAAFAWLLAAQPGLQPEAVYAHLTGQIQYANRQVGLFNLTVGSVALGLMMLSMALGSPLLTTIQSQRQWGLVALLPIGLVAAWGANTWNLDSIRADMVYKQGQAMESYGQWDYAIDFYQQAIAYTPYEDTYYRGLGQAYIDKAASLTATTPAHFNAPPPIETVLALNWKSVAQFNRTDCLYAALAVFSQARQINPLNADHTVGLAVAYQRLATAALDARQRAQVMTAARQAYAMALRLRPQDAQLQAAQPRP